MKTRVKTMNIRKTIQLLALALPVLLTATMKAQSLIYVSDNEANTIGEYTDSGSTVNASLMTGLNDPGGIAISGTNLFVANSGNGTIGEYTTSGAIINASLITGLNSPVGIAISGTNLFVLNQSSGTIGEYTTSGAVINDSLITGLSVPEGIAISGAILFVGNLENGNIGEYTTSGGTINASLINEGNPDCFAISGTNLFVTDSGSAIIRGMPMDLRGNHQCLAD